MNDLGALVAEDPIQIEVFDAEQTSDFTGTVVLDTRPARSPTAVGHVDLVTNAPRSRLFEFGPFEIHVPPLRERIDDLMPLAVHLLRRHRSDGDDDALFTPQATAELLAHKWPGNVRELANVVEHAAILCDALPIDAEHLPRHFSRRQLRSEIRDAGPMTIREMEMIAIERAIERNDGDKKAAAEELGVSVKTLYNKLNAAEEKAA